jgi:hypothetical protein
MTFTPASCVALIYLEISKVVATSFAQRSCGP